jgi:hypothetical protein
MHFVVYVGMQMNQDTYVRAMNKLRAQASSRYSLEYIEHRLKMTMQSAVDWHSGDPATAHEFIVKTTARWVHGKRKTFLPPSPETLEWGGFLGGEWV